MHQAATPCRSICTQPSKCGAAVHAFAFRGAAGAEHRGESLELNLQAAGELRRRFADEAGAREADERLAAELQAEAAQAVQLRARLERLEELLQARAYQGQFSAGGHRAVPC